VIDSPPNRRRVISAGAMILISTGLLSSAICQESVQQGAAPRQTTLTPRAADSMSEMAEILVAPLFIEAAGFTSRVIMVNGLSFAVNAQVILFDRSGHYGDS